MYSYVYLVFRTFINSGLLYCVSLQRYLGFTGVFASASSFLEVNFIGAFKGWAHALHTQHRTLAVCSALRGFKRDNTKLPTTSCAQNKQTQLLSLHWLPCLSWVFLESWAVLWRTWTSSLASKLPLQPHPLLLMSNLPEYLQQHDGAFVAHRKVSNDGSREGELENLYEDDTFTECTD